MSVKITNLTKLFGDKCILKNFSYCFADTGIYVLKGDSGVGKTTLLRMIAGLDKDYQGSIEGGGIGRVGFAFQEHRLFPQLTAFENVVFANFDTKDEAVCKKANDILTKLNISDEDKGLIPSKLSGGMKQRISLARAFISSYPILLLDEPTKELDEKNARAVRELIKDLSRERLIIIVSHNDEDVTSLQATEIDLNK
jgi:putative ABC transport system ATP-binding protein